jgi:hypothetical protein
MKEKESYQKQVQDFTSLMYQKGYRGRFHLVRTGTGRPQTMGSLRSVLEIQLSDYFNTAGKSALFELKTYADLAEKIECRFKILLSETKGLQVQQLEVLDTRSDQRKLYGRLDHNNQIPGSVAVQSLFPKPKPWDDYLKGKFRP